MSSTPREIVQQALRFESPSRLPRDLWSLPWAEENIPQCLAELRRRWPSDIGWSKVVYRPSPRVRGDQYAVGTYVDDWGSQNALLIAPEMWRDWFKPLYRDYCALAHAYGKFAFMHSDGNIASVYEDLIEVGVDALNSQLFCMDLADLERRAKGRITFWGEIDRQHVLSSPDPETGRKAVRKVAHHL